MILEPVEPDGNLERVERSSDLNFRYVFNHERPHEGLDNQTPASIYHPSSVRLPRSMPEFNYPKGLLLRRVNNSGDVSWHKNRIFISEVFRFEELGFELNTLGFYRVFFRNLEIGELGGLSSAATKDDTCAESHLILTIALQVAEFGIEVVGLNGAYPDVLGNGDVEASTDGRSIGCVVTGWRFSDRSRKVAVKAVHSAEETLSEGLEARVVGKAHSDASHSVKEAKTRVEARDVIGRVASCLDDSGEVMPDGHGDPSGGTGHPEAAAAANRRIGVHLTEGDISVDSVGRPLGQPGQGEQRKQRADEDTGQLVHRSSY